MLLRKTRFRYALLLLLSLPLLFANCGDSVENLTDEQKAKVKEVVNNTVLQPGRTADEKGITVEDLAYHWAPIHYQDIRQVDSDQSKADYITRVDRNSTNADGSSKEGGIWDLDANTKDKGLNSYPLNAYVYYSVVSTTTHNYITYTYYHPFDTMIIKYPRLQYIKDYFTVDLSVSTGGHWVWRKLEWLWNETFGRVSFDIPWFSLSLDFARVGSFSDLNFDWKHLFNADNDFVKHDFEGVEFIIKKDNGFGTLEAVLTQSHGYIWTYLTPATSGKFNTESARVRPSLIAPVFDQKASAAMGDDNVNRVRTSQEYGGHGAGCIPDWGAPSPADLRYPLSAYEPNATGGGGDHIRYIPTRYGQAESPNFSEIGSNPDGRFTYCKYKLINMFDPDGGLWANTDRSNIFTGENKNFNSSHGDPPWIWGGHKDGLDPAVCTTDHLLNLLWEKYVDKLPSGRWSKYFGTILEKISEPIYASLRRLLLPETTIIDRILKKAIGDFYPEKTISDQDKKLVAKVQHPWTHNPAYLSWAYLKTGDHTYFSNIYTWNNYADKCLNGNFTYNISESTLDTIRTEKDEAKAREYMKRGRSPAYVCPCQIPGVNISCDKDHTLFLGTISPPILDPSY
jgi:hypothetical protein